MDDTPIVWPYPPLGDAIVALGSFLTFMLVMRAKSMGCREFLQT